MHNELRKLRGDHCLNVYVTFELKKRILALADRYDRTMADIVRALIKLGYHDAMRVKHELLDFITGAPVPRLFAPNWIKKDLSAFGTEI